MTKYVIAILIFCACFALAANNIQYVKQYKEDYVTYGDQEVKIEYTVYGTLFNDMTYVVGHSDGYSHIEGPIAPSGAKHGKWYENGEEVYYFYDEKVTEAGYEYFMRQ